MLEKGIRNMQIQKFALYIKKSTYQTFTSESTVELIQMGMFFGLNWKESFEVLKNVLFTRNQDLDVNEEEENIEQLIDQILLLLNSDRDQGDFNHIFELGKAMSLPCEFVDYLIYETTVSFSYQLQANLKRNLKLESIL